MPQPFATLIVVMPPLTEAQRWQAIGMLCAGMDRHQASHHFGVQPLTISHVFSRLHEIGIGPIVRGEAEPR